MLPRCMSAELVMKLAWNGTVGKQALRLSLFAFGHYGRAPVGVRLVPVSVFNRAVSI